MEDSNETIKDSEQDVTEEHLNDEDTLLIPDDGRVFITSDNEDKAVNNEDNVDYRQRKDTEEEESNVRKKIS